MKLSIDTSTQSIRFGDEKTIQMAKKAGFDCIDYSFDCSDESKQMCGENYRELAQQVRKILDANDITCNQAHAPEDFCYGCKFDMSDEKYLKIVRSMEAAAIMGAKHIVVHSIAVPDDIDVFTYNVEFYKSFEKYCEKFGICIAIENLFSYNGKTHFHAGRLHTPEQLKRLVKALNSTWYGVCIDVGHAAITGYEPDEIIRAFNNQTLKVLHIHDNDYHWDLHLLPYEGRFNWDKIMASLKKIDYKGDFTYEIFQYLNKYNNDFMEEALLFAAKTGHYLISKFEEV